MIIENNFLFGAAYYSEYMPYERTDTDFRLMKEAGMNVIRIAESTWSTWEPKDNVYDFTHLHKMLTKAREHGLYVIIGTPTYAIPSWLAKKYPKIMSFSRNGQELYGHRQLTDINNPDYLFHAERIIRKLMEQIKPYNDIIIGYQLDNETRSAGAACPETQMLFVRKMKEKYPDIEDFNREFGLDYWSNRIASWEDFPDIRGTINGSLAAAYKAFLRDSITDFLNWQAKIIDEYRTPAQFITHNFDYSWIDYSLGIQPEVNQKDCAKCMDIAGVDIYHQSQDNLDGAMIAFGGAVGRSLKKDNYLVLETQAQGRLDWLAYPGQLRLQAYSHLSSGAASLMYWNWHSIHNSFESYWKGILSHDLLPNETYRELLDWRHEMLPVEDKLTSIAKNNRVGIIADNRSLTGLDEFPISDTLDYNLILRRVYDTLYKMNVEADLLYVDDDYSSYDVLVVPALYSVTEATIAKLREYVAAGGHLAMTFRSCFSDEELKVYSDMQPHGLTDVFGFTYDRFTAPSGVEVELDGQVFAASEWMELIRPAECEVWASYKHQFWGRYAAITHNRFGEGSATYIGTYLPEEGFATIFRRVLKLAEIDVPEYSFPIIRKSGTNKLGTRVDFYFNYSSNEVSFEFDIESAAGTLDGKTYKKGDRIKIAPWDVLIVES